MMHPPKMRRKVDGSCRRALPAGGACAFLFGDPYTEVDAGPEGLGHVQLWQVSDVESLADESCDEGDTVVVHLIGPVIHFRCRSFASLDVPSDAGETWGGVSGKVGIPQAVAEVGVEDWASSAPLRWVRRPDGFAAVPQQALGFCVRG